jgi:hypothetical protein
MDALEVRDLRTPMDNQRALRRGVSAGDKNSSDCPETGSTSTFQRSGPIVGGDGRNGKEVMSML